MIDIENEVYSYCVDVLQEHYPDVSYSQTYDTEPSKFPHVTISCEISRVFSAGRDSGKLENFANMRFDINVFTRDDNRDELNKKNEAKAIFQFMDAAMQEKFGFTRTFYSNIPNYLNSTIHRLQAYYEAIVGDDHMIYTGGNYSGD